MRKSKERMSSLSMVVGLVVMLAVVVLLAVALDSEGMVALASPPTPTAPVEPAPPPALEPVPPERTRIPRLPRGSNLTTSEGGSLSFVDSDGNPVEGLFRAGNEIYYGKSDGTVATNEWVFANGKWYFAGDTGAMAKESWVEDESGNSYYLTSSGAMVSNSWYPGPDGNMLLIRPDGRVAKNVVFTLSGENYYFDDDGKYTIIPDGQILDYSHTDEQGNTYIGWSAALGGNPCFRDSDGNTFYREWDSEGNYTDVYDGIEEDSIYMPRYIITDDGRYVSVLKW